MKSRDILLVTFPVDLGNRTLEANQQCIFKEDMDFYRFAEDHSIAMDIGRINQYQSLYYRFKSIKTLRKVVKKYSEDGKKILFNGLSPALFSYGTWDPKNVAIVFDWTRTLYPSTLGQPVKKNWLFYIHKKILNECPTFLCWTDAIIENLHEFYGIRKSLLFKVPAPFLIERLDIPPRPTPKIPRVLFIGGDLKRKGGHILIEGWQRLLKGKCSLTMMTSDQTANIEDINYLPNIRYGSSAHRLAYETSDILVLPTFIDAYPQVIGEAAAAGLAVITTKFALGAKEIIIDGVNGFISDTPEGCIKHLEILLDSPFLIDKFKAKGYELMHQKFSKAAIRESYLEILNKSY